MFGFGNDTPTPPPPAIPDPLPTPPSFATRPSTGGGLKPVGGSNKSVGIASTLLTSPSGADSTNTNLARKSLLGQ